MCVCVCVCVYACACTHMYVCVHTHAHVHVCICMCVFQFSKPYKNLQNINRRYLHVHEPLIYDSVWVAAEAMHRFTHDLYTQHNEYILRSGVQYESFIEPYIVGNEAVPYNGLTVSPQLTTHLVYMPNTFSNHTCREK